jgi:hypothetical protein
MSAGTKTNDRANKPVSLLAAKKVVRSASAQNKLQIKKIPNQRIDFMCFLRLVIVKSRSVLVAIEASGIKTRGENLNCKFKSLFKIVPAAKLIKNITERIGISLDPGYDFLMNLDYKQFVYKNISLLISLFT